MSKNISTLSTPSLNETQAHHRHSDGKDGAHSSTHDTGSISERLVNDVDVRSNTTFNSSEVDTQKLKSTIASLMALVAERDATLAQLVEGVIITDASGRITFVNEAAKKLHGVAKLDVTPDEYTETYSLFTEEGVPHPTETLPLARAVYNHETVVDARWRIRRPNGTEIIASGNARPIYHTDQTLIGSVLTIRDDTEKIESIAALRASELLSRTILEASPDCMKIIDLQGRVVYMNANGCVQMDIEDFSAIEGTEWCSLWPKGAQHLVTRALAAAAAGKQDSFEQVCFTRKGIQKWWSVVASPVLDKDGRCAQIIVASRDVTKRKEAERDLRESQHRSQLAMEATGLGVWELNLRTRIVHWDAKMFEIYGAEPTAGGVVTYDAWRALTHPNDVPRTEALLAQTIANDGPNRDVFAIRNQKNGDLRDIEVIMVSRRNIDEEVEWIVGTNLDVTNRVQQARHNALLMAEVNHRTKNLLSVIQSIARMTGKSGDLATFLPRLSKRIGSLASSQDLLIKNEWRGVDLKELIFSQLEPFSNSGSSWISIDGPVFYLSPAAAQGIGMAMHELGTNAAKYGALSNDVGCVRISWTVENEPNSTISIIWQEEGGPDVLPPTSNGFGKMVIGRMVESSTQGVVEFDYPKRGFFWKLTTQSAHISDRP